MAGIGGSDGSFYENRFDFLRRVYNQGEVPETPPTTASTMPVGGSPEPAGAFKSTEATLLAREVPETKINGEITSNFTPDSSQIDVSQMLDIHRGGPPIPMPEVIAKTKSGIEFTNEDVDTAIDVGLSAGPGTIAGVRASNIKGKLSDLGHAQIMEQNGAHPDDIWKTTGFGRGADGRWRHEIDDSQSSFDRQWHDKPAEVETPIGKGPFAQIPINTEKGNVTANLSEILDHPELYQAYPLLKDIKIVKDTSLVPDSASYWEGSGPGRLQGAVIRLGENAASNQGTLMHEVQHAIQGFEGFSKGGSPLDAPRDYQLKYTKDFEALKPEMESLVEKSKDPDSIWTTQDVERARYLGEVSRKYKLYLDAAYRQAHHYYERLAGEVEARNINTRLLLTKEERAEYPLPWSEDFSRSQQIIRDIPTSTTAYGYIDRGRTIKP